MCLPRSSTFNVKITAPAASRANATAKTSDFLTEADQESISPRNTIKKKGLGLLVAFERSGEGSEDTLAQKKGDLQPRSAINRERVKVHEGL